MTTRFLGLEFQPVLLEHKPVLQALLRRFPQRISGYTFASLAAWAGPLGFQWARMGDDCVLICRPFGPAREIHLLQPLGFMNSGCCAEVLTQARQLPYALKLLSVPKEFIASHAALSARFFASEDRAGANYLYRARDLSSLSGHRYSKKRNLIAQFEETYTSWHAVPLDERCGPACQDVLLGVARADGVPADDPSLAAELAALDFTVRHVHELEQDGLIVRVGEEPAAFSIFERLNPEVTAVHFEKARRQFKGVYQVINRETARRIEASGALFVNREEDVGDPGLRQAKLSYHPIEILPVYNLTLLPEGVTREDATGTPTTSEERFVETTPPAWLSTGGAMHRAS